MAVFVLARLVGQSGPFSVIGDFYYLPESMYGDKIWQSYLFN
jgi:hypothetical protein